MDLQKQIETSRINILIDRKVITKNALSDILGICRVTLNTRLKLGNWKKTELLALKEIK